MSRKVTSSMRCSFNTCSPKLGVKTKLCKSGNDVIWSQHSIPYFLSISLASLELCYSSCPQLTGVTLWSRIDATNKYKMLLFFLAIKLLSCHMRGANIFERCMLVTFSNLTRHIAASISSDVPVSQTRRPGQNKLLARAHWSPTNAPRTVHSPPR